MALLDVKNLTKNFGGLSAVSNVSMKVNKGEQVALVGVSGSGKTTIARLAARFYDIKSGEILIGGINIKDFDNNSLAILN